MKKFKQLIPLLLALIIISCDKNITIEDNSPKLSITSCILNLETPYIIVEVANTSRILDIRTSDDLIAKVRSYGENQFIIFGVDEGEAIVTVNASNAESAMEVKVSVTESIDRVVVHKVIQIKLGESRQLGDLHDKHTNDNSVVIEINDPSVISIQESGNIKNIKADKLGGTLISFTKDKWMYQTYYVEVVEEYDFQIFGGGTTFCIPPGGIPGEVGGGIGIIVSGSGIYSVENSNSEVAFVELKELDRDFHDIRHYNPAIVWLLHRNVAGTAVITIKDEVTGQTADARFAVIIREENEGNCF
ncbi:MAG: hypothetical protein LBI15_12140 [Dysgonamonadaceae bacterium]|jgi:hypothetical protein|nr:hypothetical protein [Dysgonamonadaceae bacterium]